MLGLIKLELKRFNLKNHLRNIAIANLLILILGVFLAYMSYIGELDDLPPNDFLTISIINMLVIATFLVWEAILIAGIVIDEFNQKTISLLFTYPVNRKKLIASKLILIVTITLGSIFISHLFQNICVWAMSRIFIFINYDFTMRNLISILITTIGSVCLGMLPLSIGMIRKSSIDTIIASLFIVSIAVNSQNGTGGIITIIPVSICLGLIGLLAAAIAIKKIIVSDLD